MPPDSLPLGESLQDCLERVGPLWRERVRPDLLAGQDVLVVAHANSLRGMLKEIDGISDTAIEGVGIPNGIPLVYEFERVERTADSALTLRPIASPNCCLPLSGEFLEERGLLRKALQREREAQKAAAMPEPPSRGPRERGVLPRLPLVSKGALDIYVSEFGDAIRVRVLEKEPRADTVFDARVKK